MIPGGYYAAALGFFAGVSLTLVVLVHLARSEAGELQRPTVAVSCEICGRQFGERSKAEAHVMSAHNAPDSDTARDCVVIEG